MYHYFLLNEFLLFQAILPVFLLKRGIWEDCLLEYCHNNIVTLLFSLSIPIINLHLGTIHKSIFPIVQNWLWYFSPFGKWNLRSCLQEYVSSISTLCNNSFLFTVNPFNKFSLWDRSEVSNWAALKIIKEVVSRVGNNVNTIMFLCDYVILLGWRYTKLPIRLEKIRLSAIE